MENRFAFATVHGQDGEYAQRTSKESYGVIIMKNSTEIQKMTIKNKNQNVRREAVFCANLRGGGAIFVSF